MEMDLHARNCRGQPEDVARMRARLEANPYIFYFVYQDIYSAVSKGHEKCLNFLIEKRMQELKDNDMEYLAHIIKIAMQYNYENITRVVLSHFTCNIETKIAFIFSFLQDAIVHNAEKTFKYLLNILGTYKPKYEVLSMLKVCDVAMTAIQYKRPECLRLVLSQGAVVDCQDVVKLRSMRKKLYSLSHHFAREITHNVTIEIKLLEILYQFGVNLWEKDANGLLPIQLIQKKVGPRRKNYYLSSNPPTLKDREELCTKLQELMRTPLSLQGMCRITIIRAMGRNNFSKMKLLPPLPGLIMSLLKFEDLRDSSSVHTELEDSESEEDDNGALQMEGMLFN